MERKRKPAEEETVSTSWPTSCEDVHGQRREHDDFISLMDENGIIGLLEALEMVGAGEYRRDVETHQDQVDHHRSGSLSHRIRLPEEDAPMNPPSPGGVFDEGTLSGVDGCSGWSCQTSGTVKQSCPGAARPPAPSTIASFKNTSSRPGRDLRDTAALSQPSHVKSCTPDYSQVKPRVNFPKVGSKSLRPPTGADSVEEDSRDRLDMSPATPDSAGDGQKLGSSREETRLLCELEENYNKLWIKYAEAENTIDHLRLAAKVNLYSEGPSPAHVVQPVYNQEASKFMTLDFPQAQRAESSSSSPPSATQQPGVTLYTQASDFLQRLQTFEDLLQCQQLIPDQQRKEISQLFADLRALESSYLLAKDEQKLLPKEEEHGRFDPDRELEGLIFDCVLYMDELKQHTEQIKEELLSREPSPPPAASSSPSEGRENLTPPQKTHTPSLVYPREGDATMLSSIHDERVREEARKEKATSLYLNTVNLDLGPSRELNTLPDDHQNSMELPQASAPGQKSKVLLPAVSERDRQPGGLEEDGPGQKIKESPPQRSLSPEDFVHPYNSAQLIIQANTLDPPSRPEGFKMRTSHSSSLSSLGEVAPLERRNSRLQAGSCRLPSQDGIVSPETDSGFNGTESCHPTPTEAPSPLHQRAVESVSAVRDRKPRNPHNGLVASPHPCSLLPRCCPATDPSTTTNFMTKQPRGSKARKAQRKRRRFSCAHQCWIKKSESGTSDIESSCSTLSEDGQNGCCRESAAPLSPGACCSSRPRHSSTEATEDSVSLQTLQAEVSRLHYRLERCLKEREPLVSASQTTAQGIPHRLRTSTPRVSKKVNTDVTAAFGNRSCCAPERGHHPRVLGSSDHPQTRSGVSRCNQTASAASDSCSSHQSVVHIKHRSVSVQAPGMPDEVDTEKLSFHSSHGLVPCLRCISRQQARAEASFPGKSDAAIGSCHHCGGTHSDCHRFVCANTNTCHQAAEPVKCCTAAAAPLPLQHVCPLPLLLCSSPLRASPGSKQDTTAGFRSQKESKSRRKHSPCAGGQSSLDCSLNKAIRAAKRMESMSGHMSRSLRTGLHHQQLLLTPLMAQLSQRQTWS